MGAMVLFYNPNSGTKITVKDVIADAMLQQLLTRPNEYDVLTTMNLMATTYQMLLAAQVGGIGIAGLMSTTIPA